MPQKHVHSLVRRAAETCLMSNNLVVISANSMIGVANESHVGLNARGSFFTFGHVSSSIFLKFLRTVKVMW